MALTAAAVFDGIRCKIVDVTESDVTGAAGALAVTFAALGMSNLPTTPTDLGCDPVASAADEDVEGGLIPLNAITAAGFTFRRLEIGAGTTKTWRVTLRVPRGITR